MVLKPGDPTKLARLVVRGSSEDSRLEFLTDGLHQERDWAVTSWKWFHAAAASNLDLDRPSRLVWGSEWVTPDCLRLESFNHRNAALPYSGGLLA